MKLKKGLLILISILIITASMLSIYLYYYLKTSVIDLNLVGDDNVTINLGDTYIDEGVSAYFKDEDISDKVNVTNNIDNYKVGTYEINYSVNYKNKSAKKVRMVSVIDNVKPDIKLKGKSKETVYLNNKYIEDGASASDNYDGDITDKIVIIGEVDNTKEGEYEILYKVSDSSGNTSEIKRVVTVKKKPLVHKDGVAVLNYHFFYGDNDYKSCSGWNCLHIDKFEEQVKYLKENNYKTLTMEEFRDYMYGKIEIPKNSVLITIDDGALGVGTNSTNRLIPILEKYEVHATLFLITGWWDISYYKSPYLDIESHSHDMHKEGYCSGVSRGAQMLCYSREEVISDLLKSIEITGSTKAFCYPFYVYNNEVIDILKELGFELAFANGGYKATRNSNKYIIPRFQIKKDITLEDFIYMVY